MKKSSKKLLLPLILLLAFVIVFGAFFAGKFLIGTKPFHSLPAADIASVGLKVKVPLPDAGTEDSLNSEIQPEEMTCRIIDGADTGNLLLAAQGDSSDIFRLTATDMGIACEELKNGMLVQVSYYDGILESYPAQFADPCGITVLDGETDDLCSLYLDVLEKLWETDSGLNSDISMISVDLSQTRLTCAEQAAIAWAFGERHGMEVLQLGFSELSEQGYLNADELCWEDGCLFSITEKDKAPSSVTFDAEKWRSGLGAYFFMDCESSQKKDGHWADFFIGAEAIS